MRKNRWKKALLLMLQMLYISSFTFGGGFVIVSFMKRIFVDRYHWLEEQEMLDLTALAQSAPGAIAVNAAILVGWRVAGLPGMLLSVLGTILPPMTILSVISLFYQAFATNPYVALALKGMQAGVAAVILDVALTLLEKLLKTGDRRHPWLAAAAFLAAFCLHVHVVVIILSAGIIGTLIALCGKRKGERHDPS